MTTFKELILHLFEALCDSTEILQTDPSISSRADDIGVLDDAYAYIQIYYLGKEPDGDRQQEYYDEFMLEGGQPIDDIEAYDFITNALTSPRIWMA